jgi:hypothetical protein
MDKLNEGMQQARQLSEELLKWFTAHKYEPRVIMSALSMCQFAVAIETRIPIKDFKKVMLKTCAAYEIIATEQNGQGSDE